MFPQVVQRHLYYYISAARCPSHLSQLQCCDRCQLMANSSQRDYHREMRLSPLGYSCETQPYLQQQPITCILPVLRVYVRCAFTDASHPFTVKCIIYISVFIVIIVEVFSDRLFAVSFDSCTDCF